MESIFQEIWSIKTIEKNEFKSGDYSSFKITKIYVQKKNHYVIFMASDWKVPYQNMRLQF